MVFFGMVVDEGSTKVSRSWELDVVVPIGYRHLSGKKCGVLLHLFVDRTSLGVVDFPCFPDICNMATAAQSEGHEGPDPFICYLCCVPGFDSRLQQRLLGRLLQRVGGTWRVCSHNLSNLLGCDFVSPRFRDV